MQFTEAVLESITDHPHWQESLNPLRTLDECWNRQIGAVIENLILDGRLCQSDDLSISMSETPIGSRIQFDIASPVNEKVGERD